MAVRRAPVLAERELWQRYPFLPGAETLLGDVSPSVRELILQPTFERSRALARARLRSAVTDPTGSAPIDELERAGSEERFLSFLYARLLLSSGGSLAPVRRFAVAESKRAWEQFRKADPWEIIEIARRLDYTITVERTKASLPLSDYLTLASNIREAEFRLVRQEVAHGAVAVTWPRAARLLQEGIRSELSDRIPIGEEVKELLHERESELLAEIRERSPVPTARGGGTGTLTPEKFPPCIRKMRRMLQASENLSHAGRFALAAFLHRAGADFETIAHEYRGAPDFDESVTRYQVEHITHKDGGAGYSPPECETLRTHGLCFREGDPESPSPADRQRDERCFRPALKHPLQYYRWAGGSTIESDRASADEVGVEERRR